MKKEEWNLEYRRNLEDGYVEEWEKLGVFGKCGVASEENRVIWKLGASGKFSIRCLSI
jgi:hypothetical protein